MSKNFSLDHVDYATLDQAKNAFIEASRKTAGFAKKYGFIPPSGFGASANVFSLNLAPFLKRGAEQLHLTLLPEGLGTADDARPDDLTDKQLERFWYNIGIKTLAVMTNDAAATGMQTLLASLYLPSATPKKVFNQPFMKGFLSGFVAACKTVECVYFSGETPQLKNKFVPGKLDIAGALFGVMPPGTTPIDGTLLKAGNRIVFIQSSGPHDNGFTSLRALAKQLPKGYHTKLRSGTEYWQAINAPTILYTPLIQSILAAGILPTNIEPITGHGWQKLMRPKHPLRYLIDAVLPVPEIFSFVQEKSGTSRQQMLKIFNYGVGLAIFVANDADAQHIVRTAKSHKLQAILAGVVEKAKHREVIVKPWKITLDSKNFLLKQ